MAIKTEQNKKPSIAQIMARYQGTQDTSTDLLDKTPQTSDRSPLQTVCDTLIDNVIPRALRNTVSKIMPQLKEFIDTIEDPDLLHETISEVYFRLGQVLRYDHSYGFGGGDKCYCAQSSTQQQSISGGNNGNGEKHLDGSDDEGIPVITQQEEETSKDSDS